ncbi:MAG: hypothetical protein OXG97_12935 [Candidatus Poribacteria bacterium]|nr:hypothetical protein [Candidatus Poribacteria bacterium]
MRMRLYAIVAVIYCFSNGLLWAAGGAGVRIEKTFTKADGLASDNVLAILEDRTGDIWIGTTEGVSRYDGEGFQTYTTQEGLAENATGLLFEDSLGRIWFASGVLGNVFAREKGVDMSLMAMPLSELAKLPGDQKPEGTQNPLSPKGVSLYDADGLRTFTTTHGLADNTILDIFQDDTGLLWLATDAGVSRYDGGTFKTLKTQGPIGMAVLPEYWNQVTAIAPDTAGNFWFASTAGITYYNHQRSLWRYFDVNLSPFQEMGLSETGHLTDLLFDAKGHLWMSRETVSIESSGIRRYDGESCIAFPQSHALPMNSVYHIMEDRNGNLWFSGVKKHFPTLQETQNTLGMTYAETAAGVSVYNGQTFENFDTDAGLPSQRVWSVFQDRNGNLWFATDAGVAVGVYDSSEVRKERRRNR